MKLRAKVYSHCFIRSSFPPSAPGGTMLIVYDFDIKYLKKWQKEGFIQVGNTVIPWPPALIEIEEDAPRVR